MTLLRPPPFRSADARLCGRRRTHTGLTAELAANEERIWSLAGASAEQETFDGELGPQGRIGVKP